jgi:predicted DNA repair protein MutK
VILALVAIVITALVYGVVALIVKMDDVGLRMVETGRPGAVRTGGMLVRGMPKLLAALSLIGTVAMLWVGGHILIAGAEELGWHGPHDVVHHVQAWVHDLGLHGGVVDWIVETTASAVLGIAVGSAILVVVSRLPFRRGGADHGAAGAH